MKNIKVLIIWALAFLVVSTSIFPFGCKKKAEVAQTFNIAIASWVGFAPFYIAEEKGYFQEQNLDARVLKIEDQGARRSAFNSGKIHGMVDTLDSFANGVPQGLNGKMVLKIDDSNGGDGLVVRKEINSVKDLTGKKIAYTQGLPPHFFLLYLLRQEGIKSKDINSLYMDAGDAGAAFVAGKVDAAVTWEPWLSQAGETKHGKILMTSKDAPGLISDIFIVNNDISKARKSDIQKVLRAWFKSIEYIEQYPNEAAEIMGKYLGIPAEEVLAMLSGLKFVSYDENLSYFGITDDSNEFIEIFNAASEIWKEEGLISDTVNGDAVYDAIYLRDLYK